MTKQIATNWASNLSINVDPDLWSKTTVKGLPKDEFQTVLILGAFAHRGQAFVKIGNKSAIRLSSLNSSKPEVKKFKKSAKVIGLNGRLEVGTADLTEKGGQTLEQKKQKLQVKAVRKAGVSVIGQRDAGTDGTGRPVFPWPPVNSAGGDAARV